MGLSGQVVPTVYPPVLVPFPTSTVFNPSTAFPWANYFDVIVCGDGSGGCNAPLTLGGIGGNHGGWGVGRMTKAQAVTAGLLTITIGTGGARGAIGGYSGAGTGSSVVAAGSAFSVSGYGGVGVTGTVGGAYAGIGNGPGNQSYPDYHGDPNTYDGGPAQSNPQGQGNTPGGGGAGGQASELGAYYLGGYGAPGYAWILAYQ